MRLLAATQDEPKAGNRVVACPNPIASIGTTITPYPQSQTCQSCELIELLLQNDRTLLSLIDCFGGCCQLDGPVARSTINYPGIKLFPLSGRHRPAEVWWQ